MDLSNQKFGELLVLEKTDKRDNGSIVWKCQCSCGNIVYWDGGRLQQTKNPNCMIYRKIIMQINIIFLSLEFLTLKEIILH